MKLEALTIAVNYDDLFIHVAKENHMFFDKWVVVTDFNDTKITEICSQYPNIILIRTDVFYKNNAVFKKYAAINEGLKYISKDAWVLFLDADIVLSQYTRRVLDNLPLQKDIVYGIDRVNCKTFEDWIDYKKGKNVLFNNWLLNGASFEFGSRIVHIYGEQGDNGKFTGWKPLGFTQICHRSSFDVYPEGSMDASHGDIQFIKDYFPRDKRVLIPEILGIHLSTELTVGLNHQGRKSLRFDYSNNTSIFKKLCDGFIIWVYSLFVPNYYSSSLFCKIYNYIKQWLRS